ncbi:unnamed protein product, partial [Ectocarpus fasciculatus]
FLRASVRVLRRNTSQSSTPTSSHALSGGGGGEARWWTALPPAPLANTSVRQLLKELNDIVDPPRKLPRFKVHLRRAPTQEEFFRGSLSKNPLYSTDIMPS